MNRKNNIQNRKILFSPHIIILACLLIIIGLWVLSYYASKKETVNIAPVSLNQELPTSDHIDTEKEVGIYDEKYRNFVSPVIQDVKGEKSFGFVLSIPTGWKITRNEFALGEYTLQLEKQGYIFNVAGPTYEQSNCLYAENGNIEAIRKRQQTEGNIGVAVDQFVSISNSLGELRFGRLDPSLHKDFDFIDFITCSEKMNSTTPEWISETKIGYISLRTPYNYDQKLVDEVIRSISALQYHEK